MTALLAFDWHGRPTWGAKLLTVVKPASFGFDMI
jgi:hypothetical protein